MMKPLNINNPSVEVGAENIAARNLAIWGGSGRLPVYDNMEAVVTETYNQILLTPGIYSNQGYEIEVPEVITFTYKTESAGIKRYDLIISELMRDTNGVETHTIRLVQGTAAILPTKPFLTVGDFMGGENARREIIHTILVDGTKATVESSAPLLSISGNINKNITVANSEKIGGHSIFIQQEEPKDPQAWDIWIW